ncbi:MAG: hypothetical protein ACLGI8_00080 [Acidimicrobiia bacterium]
MASPTWVEARPIRSPSDTLDAKIIASSRFKAMKSRLKGSSSARATTTRTPFVVTT